MLMEMTHSSYTAKLRKGYFNKNNVALFTTCTENR